MATYDGNGIVAAISDISGSAFISTKGTVVASSSVVGVAQPPGPPYVYLGSNAIANAVSSISGDTPRVAAPGEGLIECISTVVGSAIAGRFLIFKADGFVNLILNSSGALGITLYDSNIEIAPGSLTGSVYNAFLLDQLVVFKVDGIEVLSAYPNNEGMIPLISIPVPDLLDIDGNHLMQPGVHTLSILQGSATAETTFTVANPPIVDQADGTDLSPTMASNESSRWSFEDVMPGGIGKWVLPMNPSEMTSPPFTRKLTNKTTTASAEHGGAFHFYEDGYTPVEWTFKGYCPTPEMRSKLEQYANLNRRWYLKDHRDRAWIVTMKQLELTPKLVQNWNGKLINDGHEYSATVLVLSRDWIQV